MNFIQKHFKKIIAVLILPVVFVATIATTPTNNYFEISKNLDVFATLYKELNTYYVDDIEPATLIRSGIDAMLQTLDPYTNFISEDEMEDYRLQTTGKYGGIGAYIRKVDDFVVVSEPYENYPAFKAGLMSGDIITEIEGQSVKDKNSDDVSKLLKGQAGTAVSIKINRPLANGQQKEMIISLTREEIKLLNVPFSGMINDEIGYIRLANFTENAGKEVREALEALKLANPGIKGVVFDVRGNPGGLLNEAVNVSNVFVDKGKEIVSTKGKVKEWDKVFRSLNPSVDPLIPLVVLTSRGSASASEIVAGAIQDLDRGVVIGQKTFGKGLVQTTRPLSYNTKLKVTTAKYYVPSGRCIQAINYAEKDDDGSVKRIADSLKTEFKTLNGRIVYDGGGIDPDIVVEPDKLSAIAVSLLTKNHIFNYATQYRVKNAIIPTAKNFSLSDADYQDFTNYLKDKEYDYTTETEEMLKDFKKTAEEEKYYDAVKKDFEALAANVKHDKEKDLVKFKDEIKQLLEDEIVTRYYYSKGRTELSFRYDKDIQEALKVLNNKTVYYQTLQPIEATAKETGK
jgi:carboxyl-terminal processing protease